MNPKIRLQVPSYDSEDIEKISEILESTNVVMGDRTIQFQKQWSKWLNVPYSTMTNSGSSANLLVTNLLLSKRGNYRLKRGDEVLVPAVTWSTTLFPIIQLGLKPVLVDVKSNTFNIDVNSCKEALSDRTKAIFIVHLLGNPCNMDEINEFCRKNNLLLIEDCCESHGACWDDNKVGTFGLASTFSFMFAHHISTIEGGMISCKDKLDDSIIKASRAHGWIREIDSNLKQSIVKDASLNDDRFLFWDLGFNLRPTEINSALGISQLKKLDKFIEIRNRNFNLYEKEFEKIIDFVQIQELEDTLKSFRSNFAFGFFIKDCKKFSAQKFISYMESHGIESRTLVAGNLARHPFYNLYCDSPEVSLKNSDLIHNGGIYLPNNQSLSENDIRFVCDTAIQFFRE